MNSEMQRREFITLLGGGAAAAWPHAARAQQDGRMRRVGLMIGGDEADPEMRARLAAFRQGLEKLGWSEGRNVRIDTRFAVNGAGQFQTVAKELVALQPDVIFVQGTPRVAAMQRESRTIPIVFAGANDPIGSDFIASLARPGGNITGFTQFEPSVTGKWLAMLKEIAPRLARAAFIGNPKTMPYDFWLRTAAAPASSLAIELVSSQVETAADIERAIESFARVPNGGLLQAPAERACWPIRGGPSLLPTAHPSNRYPSSYPNRLLGLHGNPMFLLND
jgi:putative ABC transport system substrate-binding protein